MERKYVFMPLFRGKLVMNMVNLAISMRHSRGISWLARENSLTLGCYLRITSCPTNRPSEALSHLTHAEATYRGTHAEATYRGSLPPALTTVCAT